MSDIIEVDENEEKSLTNLRQLTDKEYAQIQTMAGIRLTEKEIACVMDIPLTDFDKMIRSNLRLKEALQKGRAKGLAKIKERAYELAMSGESPSFLMFYLKTQAGWRERDRLLDSPQLTHDDRVKEIKQMTKEERQARIAQLEELKKIRKSDGSES